MNITGIDKAVLLCELYSAARTFPGTMASLHYVPGELSVVEAEQILERSMYIDYLRGRVHKVDLSGSELDGRLYDRDNGAGAAEAAVLRARERSAR